MEVVPPDAAVVAVVSVAVVVVVEHDAKPHAATSASASARVAIFIRFPLLVFRRCLISTPRVRDEFPLLSARARTGEGGGEVTSATARLVIADDREAGGG
jgi:hypothetical protein